MSKDIPPIYPHLLRFSSIMLQLHFVRRFFAFAAQLGLCALAATLSTAHAAEPKPIVPTETIQLFNGKDLTNWYTWIDDTGREDPRGVFKVQPDGILRISGDGFGGLTTNNEYANYYLIIEYRWGKETWGTRKDKSRDSGLLLHCQGPDGNFGGSKDKPGPWMTSLECQIIEGGVGDILVLRGKDADGKEMHAEATCEIARDRDGEAVWKAGGKVERFERGRINWYGRDPDWKDVLGIRGKDDVDSPGQEWTTLECFCHGDNLTYRVNGHIVNRASKVSPAHGKILLQTEGAEIFVRRLELRPLPAKLP